MPHVRAGLRRGRGPGDGLGRRSARVSSRAARAIEWGEEIEIAQGAEIGRPATLYARVQGGGGLIDSVEVGGSAVVVARGEFRL